MKRLLCAAAALAFAGMLPGIARADAYGDLEAMRNAFNATRSWHAVEKMPDGRTVTVDYSAPDRWRIVNPAMTEIVVGSDIYMVRNGKTTKMPSFLGGMVQRTLDAFRFQSYDADVKASARDLGMKMVNGKPAHAYSYTTKGTPVTMYVGSNRLPIASEVQMKGGTMTISYSGWNSAIAISP